MSSSTTKPRTGKTVGGAKAQQPSSNATEKDTLLEKTDGKTGVTEKTRDQATRTEQTKNSGGKTGKTEVTEVAKVEESKKKDGSREKTDGTEAKVSCSGGNGSGGKLSETGRKSETGRTPKKIGGAAAAAAVAAKAPPPRASLPRTPSEKTARSSSLRTARPLVDSKGRRSVPLVVAKPSGPRAHVKSNTPSVSSTTKDGPSDKVRPKTPTTPVSVIEPNEKSCMAPSDVAGPPSCHLGVPIAILLMTIFIVLLGTMTYFIIKTSIEKAAAAAEFNAQERADRQERQRQRAFPSTTISSFLEEGNSTRRPPTAASPIPLKRPARHSLPLENPVRAKFRLREPPDPTLP